MDIVLCTDGGSTVTHDVNNKRYGGIGITCITCDDMKIKNKLTISKGYIGKTVSNQRMELLACITGIEKVIEVMAGSGKLWNLTIITDSMYTINTVTVWAPDWIKLGWKRKVGNNLKDNLCHLDLIKKLYELSCLYKIKYKHIRSHQKEPIDNKSEWAGNKKADELAGAAMKAAIEKAKNIN